MILLVITFLGSVIIFTGLASRIFLRKRLQWYKWMGMLVIFGGLIVVGAADLFDDKCVYVSQDNDETVCDEKSERLHSIIGDFIMITAQVIYNRRVISIWAHGFDENYIGFSDRCCFSKYLWRKSSEEIWYCPPWSHRMGGYVFSFQNYFRKYLHIDEFVFF